MPAGRAFEHSLIIGDHHATFTARDDLVVLEAEYSGLPDGTQSTSAILAAHGLGGILQDRYVVSPGNIHDLIHLSRPAPHMYRDDASSQRGDLALDILRIERQCIIDFRYDRNGPYGEHCGGRGYVSVGRHNHFVSGTDTQTYQSRHQGSRTSGDGQRIAATRELLKRRLKTGRI